MASSIRTTIKAKDIFQAVSQSSRIEGLSLAKAQKNKAVIKRLKTYGRAFSV